MTTEEKAAAFDLLAVALTNRWGDGSWTWWCCSPCGGESKRETHAEAVADLVAWAVRIVKLKVKKHGNAGIHQAVRAGVPAGRLDAILGGGIGVVGSTPDQASRDEGSWPEERERPPGRIELPTDAG